MDIVDQHVRFAIQHFVAALDGELREGLGDVTLAQARRPDQQCVLTRLDERQRGEERAISRCVRPEASSVAPSFVSAASRRSTPCPFSSKKG
jgi:hypothetical protein